MGQHSSDNPRLEMVAALEALPAHYLENVLLRDFETLTISELSQRLLLTPAAMKSRVRRGRQLVREYLLS